MPSKHTTPPASPRLRATKAQAATPKGASAGGNPAAMAEDQAEPAPARVVQKKAFVDRVVAASGSNRAQARPIIEATLDQLGVALAAGETLAVPPFGRARVSRQKDIKGGEVITLRLRRRQNREG